MHVDKDGRSLRIGDTVIIVGGVNVGETVSIVGFDDQFVRITGCGWDNFGKFPYNVRLKPDKDLQVDVGL